MSTKLREERASLWDKMKSALDDSSDKGMTAEESKRYEEMEIELRRLTADIEARDRADDLEKRLAAPQPLPDGAHPETRDLPLEQEKRQYNKAFRSYLVDGMEMINPEERAILRKGWVEARALGGSSGIAGGYLVPDGFANKIWEAMKYFGPMRQVAGTISTETGNDILYPNVDDTGNVGEIVPENGAISEQDVSFGARTLKAFKYSSKRVKVSWELLQDSAIDVEQLLSQLFARRIGRIQNTHFTTGFGGAQPEGILTNITTVNSDASGAVTFDDLIDLEHSVDPEYRNAPGAAWMMNDAIVGSLRKQRWDGGGGAGTGGYLWEPGLQAGEPDRILGRPYYVNNDMDGAPAQGDKTVVFGDIKGGYLIRDVKQLTMVRLNELYAENGQVGFLMWSRTDGQPIYQAGSTLPPYKALVQV